MFGNILLKSLSSHRSTFIQKQVVTRWLKVFPIFQPLIRACFSLGRCVPGRSWRAGARSPGPGRWRDHAGDGQKRRGDRRRRHPGLGGLDSQTERLNWAEDTNYAYSPPPRAHKSVVSRAFKDSYPPSLPPPPLPSSSAANYVIAIYYKTENQREISTQEQSSQEQLKKKHACVWSTELFSVLHKWSVYGLSISTVCSTSFCYVSWIPVLSSRMSSSLWPDASHFHIY